MNFSDSNLFNVDLNNYTELKFLSDTLDLSKKALIPINFFLATMPTYFISKELIRLSILLFKKIYT